MNKAEQIDFMISILLAEQPQYQNIKIPLVLAEKTRLFRSLVNLRPAQPISNDFLNVQDTYLLGELEEKGIVSINDLAPLAPNLYLWQGDITRIEADAIVNAANSAMLGCFHPCHGCIDNAIHTYAGVQLRLDCDKLMKSQGFEEPTGCAKLTKAYNLPSRYVIHTVGPIIRAPLTKRDCELLSSCYQSCMNLAAEHGLRSIAFCCISTGEFHFPKEQAAEIAVNTVKDFLRQHTVEMKVIFNVFQESDFTCYTRLLAGASEAAEGD